VPSDLSCESGGPITFDSRSRVSFLDSSFLGLFWCLLYHIGR